MDGNEKEIFERLTALESSCKSAHKRIDHIEEISENVQKIVVEMQHMREDLNRATEKIETIEAKPAAWWNTLINAGLGAIGGGIVTFIITKAIGG